MMTMAMSAAGANWMDPQYLLSQFGTTFFWVSAAIVFIECGLLFPILPGDSLLFAVGMFIHRGDVSMNLLVALVVLSLAAFAGNVAGYEIGRALGSRLYERDGRIIKRKYFDQTIEFFDQHGNKALVIGRFVPIVRTFITVVAGVGRMDRRRFFTWSAIGAVLWVVSITLLGYFLGGVQVVQDHLEAAILLLVAISLLPMVFEFVMHRRRAKAVLSEVGEAATDIVDGTPDGQWTPRRERNTDGR